jgi:hypothetical protein
MTRALSRCRINPAPIKCRRYTNTRKTTMARQDTIDVALRNLIKPDLRSAMPYLADHHLIGRSRNVR